MVLRIEGYYEHALKHPIYIESYICTTFYHEIVVFS